MKDLISYVIGRNAWTLFDPEMEIRRDCNPVVEGFLIRCYFDQFEQYQSNLE